MGEEKMRCPACGKRKLRVVDSRQYEHYIRRRRECEHCLTRFNTREKIVYQSLPSYILKRLLHEKE